MNETSDESPPDVSTVPRSPTGVFLCGEPCGLQNLCRMGVLAARMDDDRTVLFDIECPTGYRETPRFAHVSWTAGVMSEICGQVPLFLGVVAYAGTIQTRFQAPVPVGERLIGQVTLEGRERRKLFMSATLTSTETGAELATASGISIAIEMRNLRDRGEL